MARVPNLNKDFYLKVKEKFPKSKPVSGDLLKSAKELDKLMRENEDLLNQEIDNHSKQVKDTMDEFSEREKNLREFLKKHAPKKSYPKTKRRNKTSYPKEKTVSKVSISHPSIGRIESPSDFNKRVQDNTKFQPPHTYDLSKKSGTKKYRRDIAKLRSNKKDTTVAPENKTVISQPKKVESVETKSNIKTVSPTSVIQPRIFTDKDLPFGGNRPYDNSFIRDTNREVISGGSLLDPRVRNERLQNSRKERALEENERVKLSVIPQEVKDEYWNKRKEPESQTTIKPTNKPVDKCCCGSMNVKSSAPSTDGKDIKEGAKDYSTELLKLTTKMVVSKVLLPKVDPDVRLLIALLFKPVAKQLGGMFKSIGTRIISSFRDKKLKNILGSGSIKDNIKDKISSMKIGERFNTFKGAVGNLVGINSGRAMSPPEAKKSLFQKYNDITQTIKTTDTATSGEDPQMGKVRRSYGIFFNYLNNKSNIFKGSINKVFDTMAGRTIGFGKAFNKILGTFGKLKEMGSGKGGMLSGLMNIVSSLFGKGGMLAKVGAGLMKFVKIIGSIIATVAGWGIGKIFGGKKPDIGGKPKPKTKTTPKTKGFLGKAWESTKGLGKKLLSKGGIKAVGKSALKKIPVIGALAGLGFGLQRLLQGDIKGAGMEVASGVMSTVPIVGTAGSVGMDLAIMARDQQIEDEKLRGKIKPTNTGYINKQFDEFKQYNINKDAKGKEVSVQPIVIDQSSVSNVSSGGGGFLTGANEPLIVDPRNNILTQVILNSLSKGVV